MSKKSSEQTEVAQVSERVPCTLNLMQRINEVRKEVTYIQKEFKSGMKYSVVSHDAVTAKLRPSLVKWGISFYPVNMDTAQDGNRTEAKFMVQFVNVDNPEDFILVSTFGYGIDTSDKGPGKAVSYGVKMALLKTFNLESGEGEDPDFYQDTMHEPGEKPGKYAKLDAVIKNKDSTQQQIVDAFQVEIEKTTSVVQLESLFNYAKSYIGALDAETKGLVMLDMTARKTAIKQKSDNNGAL